MLLVDMIEHEAFRYTFQVEEAEHGMVKAEDP